MQDAIAQMRGALRAVGATTGALFVAGWTDMRSHVSVSAIAERQSMAAAVVTRDKAVRAETQAAVPLSKAPLDRAFSPLTKVAVIGYLPGKMM